MIARIAVEDQINYDQIARVVEQRRDLIVQSVAEQSAARGSANAPYDTGWLSENIDAEAMADDPRSWGVYARTEYALIQELRQPYLYTACLEVITGGGLRKATRKHKLTYRTARQTRSADRARAKRTERASRREDRSARRRSRRQKVTRHTPTNPVPSGGESNRDAAPSRK